MNHEEFTQIVNQLRARVNTRLFHAAGLNAAPEPPNVNDAVEGIQVSLEELRVAEEELRQQDEGLMAARHQVAAEQARYQDLFDFAPEGYLITDRNGKILEVNHSAALLLNMQRAYLPNKYLASYVVEVDRSAFRARLGRFESRMRALAGGKSRPEYFIIRDPEWEVRLQPVRAEPFDAALTVAAVLYGEDLRLRWTLRDISERRVAQEALRESEARFRTLAETVVAAILIIQAGEITYANSAACKMAGCPAPELLGREFLSLVHPEYRADLQQLGLGAPRAGPSAAKTAPVRRELRLSTGAGGYPWVDLTAGPMLLKDTSAWVVTAYDITPRVEIEQAREELLRRLVEVQEEERLRISRELHDQIGQSLSALLLGLKSIEAGVPAEHLPRLRQVQSLAAELGHDTHQLALDLRPAALDDLGLSAALAAYAEEWSERHGIHVDYQSSIDKNSDLPIQAALAVYRIVQEALANVARHAQARKVSLVLTLGADFDRWRTASQGAGRGRSTRSLLAVVEDDGVGFNAEELGRSVSSKGRMGLLGMKERAELLGGRVDIESEAGRGTAVFVRIPLVQGKEGCGDR